MNAVLNGLLDKEVPPNRYSPLVIKTESSRIVSSENFSYFNAENLQDLNAFGVAVIREPAAWVTSMATQDLLFGISHNFKDEDGHFGVGLTSSEEQLVHLIKSYCHKYINMIENIDSWSKVLINFRLIPYSTDGGIFDAISEQVGALGVHCKKSVAVGQLRISHDFELAQIAFAVYLTARYKFKCSRTQSCILSSIAVGLDKLVFSESLTDVSQSVNEQINDSLVYAHERYTQLMRANGKGMEIRPLQFRRFQVLEDTYSRALIDSLISVRLGFSQVPDDFDADQYLTLNPEIDTDPASSNRAGHALNHYRRIGYKEARPVPKKAN
jgi:hypothetical protein